MSIFDKDIVASKIPIEEYRDMSITALKLMFENHNVQLKLLSGEYDVIRQYFDKVIYALRRRGFLGGFDSNGIRIPYGIQLQVHPMAISETNILCTELIQLEPNDNWKVLYSISFQYKKLVNESDLLLITWSDVNI